MKYVKAFKEHELELKVDDPASLISFIESRTCGPVRYSEYVRNAEPVL